MTSWAEIERQVEQRAGGRCEYCRMHQFLQGSTFHTEHIMPRSQDGPSTLDNLALACPRCNLHKSNRTLVSDPDSGEWVAIFHPRKDGWDDHFRWEDYHIIGVTMTGRATLAALDLNHPRRLRIREAEEKFDLFPLEREGGN